MLAFNACLLLLTSVEVLPDTQVLLNFFGLKWMLTRSSSRIFLPENLGPESGGVIITTANAIRPITERITYFGKTKKNLELKFLEFLGQ
jgi:hypothetical protein